MLVNYLSGKVRRCDSILLGKNHTKLHHFSKIALVWTNWPKSIISHFCAKITLFHTFWQKLLFSETKSPFSQIVFLHFSRCPGRTIYTDKCLLVKFIQNLNHYSPFSDEVTCFTCYFQLMVLVSRLHSLHHNMLYSSILSSLLVV